MKKLFKFFSKKKNLKSINLQEENINTKYGGNDTCVTVSKAQQPLSAIDLNEILNKDVMKEEMKTRIVKGMKEDEIKQIESEIKKKYKGTEKTIMKIFEKFNVQKCTNSETGENEYFILGLKKINILNRLVFSIFCSLFYTSFYLFFSKFEKKIKFNEIFKNINKNATINISLTFIISLFLVSIIQKPEKFNTATESERYTWFKKQNINNNIAEMLNYAPDYRCILPKWTSRDSFDTIITLNKKPFLFKLSNFLPRKVKKCSYIKEIDTTIEESEAKKNYTTLEYTLYKMRKERLKKGANQAFGDFDNYQILERQKKNCVAKNRGKKKINTDYTFLKFRNLYKDQKSLFWFTAIPFIAIMIYGFSSYYVYGKRKKNKYTFTKTKKAMIFMHVTGGMLGGIFGFLGYTLKSQFFSYISAMSIIFLHSPTAFYNTFSTYGKKQIMVPSYLFLITANLSKSFDILQYPCNMQTRIDQLYLLTTYLWVRIFSITFRALKIYPKGDSPTSYTTAIAFSGFVSLGIAMGRFGPMLGSIIFVIYSIIKKLLERNKKWEGKKNNIGYMESSSLGFYLQLTHPKITGIKDKDDVTFVRNSIKVNFLKIKKEENIPISLYVNELKWLGYLEEDIYNHISNDFNKDIEKVKEYIESGYINHANDMIVDNQLFEDLYEKYIFLSHYDEKFFIHDRRIVN